MIATMLHPSIMIFVFVILLFFARNKVKIFSILAILCPLTVIFSLLCSDEVTYKFMIYNSQLQFNIDKTAKLISFSFALVSLFATLYSLGKKNNNFQIIIGVIYFGVALFSVSADDLLSMFGSLELLMLVGCSLISQHSPAKARQYFLVHFFSGSLMLVGIIYLITSTGSTKIVELAHILETNCYIYFIMLASCLINIAAFPFSFWLSNCYPAASNQGLIYLLSFPTKTSLLILIKLFGGVEILTIFGVMTIIYGIIRAMLESNLKKLLCFYNISSLGVMIIYASITAHNTIHDLILYIFFHIISNCLLSVSLLILIDETNVINCSELKRVDNKLINFSFIIAMLTMLNIPFSSVFYIKTALVSQLGDNLSIYGIGLFNILLFVILPVKEYINAKLCVKISLNSYASSSLVLLNFCLLTFNFTPYIFEYLHLSFEYIKVDFYVLTKQIIMIFLALIVYHLGKKFSRNNILNKLHFLFNIKNNFKYFLLMTWQKFSKNKAIFTYKINNLSLIQRDMLNLFFILRLNALNISIYASFTLLLALLLTLHYR